MTSFGEWIADTIEWQVIGCDGTKYALLEGNGSDDKAVIVGKAKGVWSTHYVDLRHQGSAGTVR